MKISTSLKTLFTIAIAIAMAMSLSFSANAHRVWILPSSTNLSGDAPWVTFDAAVSNSLFVFEHVPLRIKALKIQDPTGKNVEAVNMHTGKFRTSFDLNLVTQGTYKIGYATGGLNARWKDENGKRKMWPARGKMAKDSNFDTAVPKNADSLVVAETFRRLETFVTSGEPTENTFKPTNSGLELIPVTHPNDLFVGETATFKFLFEGKPAAGAKLTVVAGNMRYRNQQNELEFVTDKEGIVEITWPEAGMYLLKAEFEDNKAKAPATVRKGNYGATLEVLPL